MSNLVIVGMQWGDEGKGKVVDALCPAFDWVARYQGGNNAGHTVKFGDQHYALHLIPSGILHDGVRCVLGNGMVIPPDAFEEELGMLRAAGVEVDGRLFVSDRAQLLGPGHRLLDQARENAAADGRIGTTSRGIGPAYEGKAARFGVRVGDLWSPGFEERLRFQVDRIAAELGGAAAADLLTVSRRVADRAREVLEPFVLDTSAALNRALRSGESILFEGAQGTLLDIDFGTYPYVTSSNSTAGGACTGTGVPPTAIDGVVGILKAYSTRVGEGPFPTELLDERGEQLRSAGAEFGTTTGRPRRCGWLDLVVGRFAVQVNGVGAIALTKLDVLDQLAEVPVCVGYRCDGRLVEDLPADLGRLQAAEPVYEVLPGWQTETVGARDFSDLPANAQSYVRFLEEALGVGVELVSTGPKREETIFCTDMLERWLGPRLEVVLKGLRPVA